MQESWVCSKSSQTKPLLLRKSVIQSKLKIKLKWVRMKFTIFGSNHNFDGCSISSANWIPLIQSLRLSSILFDCHLLAHSTWSKSIEKNFGKIFWFWKIGTENSLISQKISDKIEFCRKIPPISRFSDFEGLDCRGKFPSLELSHTLVRRSWQLCK